MDTRHKDTKVLKMEIENKRINLNKSLLEDAKMEKIMKFSKELEIGRASCRERV